MKKKIFFLTAMILRTVLFSVSPAEALTRVVKPSVIYASEIELTEDQTDYVTYAVKVPEKAVGMKITVTNSPADLDIFIGFGEEVGNYHDAELYSISDDFNETFYITRFSETPLKPGVYYVDFAYQRSQYPVVRNRVLRSIPFTFMVELLYENIERHLLGGETARSKLLPQEGMFRTFTVRVPEDAEVLRLDLFGSAADLDMLVKYGAYPADAKDADFTVETLMTRESLVIRREGLTPLREGIYYITVLDQIAAEYPVPFVIAVSFNDEPPRELLRIPRIPEPVSALDRVLRSTVEILGESGKGSGCFISPRGYILTNWHVVRDYSGNPGKRLSVAADIDHTVPPVELFRAEVVRYDSERDLALLRVVSGLYGQHLPAGYAFPSCPVNWDSSPKIGDAVGFIGYPGIGGTGSRASITYTKGVISGFEQTSFGTILKADGLINAGSSGGAAVDGSFSLIGLPTTIMEENASQLGFIHPVGLIPREWVALMNINSESD